MYKKITTLLFAIVFCSINVFAQTPTYQWGFSAGNTQADLISKCVTDVSGNVYVVGWFHTVVDFDPSAASANLSSNSGSQDIFVAKYNSLGAYQWAFNIDGPGQDSGYDIKLDASGNVYIVGSFQNTADFNPSASTANLTANGLRDVFIAKYTSAGIYQWAISLGSAANDDEAFGIALDASNNVYATGFFSSTADFNPSASVNNLTAIGGEDVFIAKYSSAGVYQWAFNVGSSGNDRGMSIVTDATTGVSVTGYFSGTADFDPSASTANNSCAGVTDIFLSKYNSAGGYQWSFGIGNSSADQGADITSDPSGNLYLTGIFSGTVDFDPSASTNTITTTTGAFVSKYNPSGQYQFAFPIGTANSRGLDILAGQNNDVYVSGYFSGTADFDPSVAVANITSLGTDGFAAKYTYSGSYNWGFNIGGAGATTYGNGITVDPLGNLFLAGQFIGANIDLDPSASSAMFNWAGIGCDLFLARYNQCLSPIQPSSIVGQSILCQGSANTYSTPPVSGATSYSWSLPGGWTGISTTNTISTTPGSSGNITVTANNTCGKSSNQTLSVTVNPQPTITVNSGSICPGQSFTIIPSGASTYTYSSGSAVVSPTANATYSVSGTSSAGCVSASPAISNVTVNALPTISASTNNTLLCTGQSATLTASGASTYTWSPGGVGTSIVVSPTVIATYTINGTSAQGCNNSSTFTQSVSACTGIASVGIAMSSEVEAYPNPANEVLNIDFQNFNSNVNIKIINAIGQVVLDDKLTTQHSSFNIQQFPSGIYFIKIGTVTKKIIKE